jgi:UDP-glucose 4-epimerase
MKDKSVVITGGAGFIGSNLAEELATSNRVIIIDDLSTGRKENIDHLLQKDNVKFIQGSISDLKLLQNSFRGIDFVFHQAALPSVPRSVKDPKASNEVNITGTLNVLLAARDNKVRKVVYASSSSVYGDTPALPKSEDMSPNPQSPYALTKLVGEYYCRIFHQLYNLPAVCLRYFNVYGPRQDPNSQYAAVIPRFIARLARGKPPVIYGDGEQTRDFTYIKDVVQANLVAAVGDATGILNIGRGERNSINRLAQIIINIMGKDLQPVYEPPLPGDVRHSLADISRAKEIGYSPEYDLETGLKQTIESCLTWL